MRVCIVSSCGKKKAISHINQPSCRELTSIEQTRQWRKRFLDIQYRAGSMYTGYQNRELKRAITNLRGINKINADFFIISAGFGILHEDEYIPPYDCSFTGMKKEEISSRSKDLNIPVDFQKICDTDYDLIYLAIGSDYMRSLGTKWSSDLNRTIICFQRINSSKNIIYIPANIEMVKAYSAAGYKIHGVVGFKGDLLRILTDYALTRKNPYEEIKSWVDPNHLYNIYYSLGGIRNPIMD